MKVLRFCFCFVFSNLANALDFEQAKHRQKFHDIGGDSHQTYTIHPERVPALSLYYDNPGRHNHSSEGSPASKRNSRTIEINLVNDWESSHDALTAGLSIVFLKFTAYRKSTIEVHILKEYTQDYGTNTTNYTILPNVELPTTSFDPLNVVKSYPEHGEKWSVRRVHVTMVLNNWDSSNELYLTITSYKLGKYGDTRQECGDSSRKRWWDCNRVTSEDGNVLCINYDLTCDFLPNCAKLAIPNPDENCISNGVQAALQLLVYCLLTIFLVLLIAGCTRCCLRGCSRQTFQRRNSDIIEIINEDQCSRPDNSPPSYDDAMKFVNEAFGPADSESAEPPPTYSPTLAAGEEEITSNTFPSSPHLQTDTSFDNNFVDLPSDPPPYTASPRAADTN